jgi:hypothetical protein
MKNPKSITQSRNGLLFCPLIIVPFLLSGCYTVLKQSSDYYSEFDQRPVARDTSYQNDKIESDSAEIVKADVKNSEEDNETVVNNYYEGGYYPYRDWWGGYGYYPYGLGFGFGYDYWYWGGCYYPTLYGHYRPYYPYAHGYGGFPRRTFGGRYYVTQPAFVGARYASVGGRSIAGAGASQRSYKVGASATTNRTSRVSRSTPRQYKSGGSASGPARRSQTTARNQKSSRASGRTSGAFAKASQSHSVARSGNTGGRGSFGGGGRSGGGSPRSGGGGGRGGRGR